MIGTELLEGQGLGNQLFCYVSARCIALDRGYDFGTFHPEAFGNTIHAKGGLYFMEADTGQTITEDDANRMSRYDEKEDRLFLGNSAHDMTHGCYVTGTDERLLQIPDNTLLYGNMQDERYFIRHRKEIAEWLKVKETYDTHEYTADDLCVIHLRYGDYSGSPELLLDKRYWKNGIRRMKEIRQDMRFLIVTESVEYAARILPGIPAVTNDIATDYAILKNARYLLLGNSSFAVFPALTSDTLITAIAPKYWARHNVSDGYWASEQNIYSFFQYMDKKGRLFTPEQCRAELEAYKKTSPRYAKINVRPEGIREQMEWMNVKRIHTVWMGKRALRSLKRRLGIGTQPV